MSGTNSIPYLLSIAKCTPSVASVAVTTAIVVIAILLNVSYDGVWLRPYNACSKYSRLINDNDDKVSNN